MKHGLTILLLVLTATTDAQTLREIDKRIGLLEKNIALRYDTSGFSTLPKVKYLCDSHLEAFDVPDNKTMMDFYHVVDLNDDGLKDLVYSGPCLPYYQTGIFLNDGKSLNVVYSYPGEIISLEKYSDKTVINTLKEACCCDYYSHFTEVTIWNDSHVEKNQITFEGNTPIKVGQVRKLRTNGILRTSPEVNDTKREDECSGQIIEGNHLTHIVNPTTLIQLGHSGEWKLVLYQVDKDNSFVGWIK